MPVKASELQLHIRLRFMQMASHVCDIYTYTHQIKLKFSVGFL